MNRDTAIRLAREARLVAQAHPLHPWGATDADIERFAALVAAAERERCAQICEDHFSSDGDWCAQKIRSSEVGRG